MKTRNKKRALAGACLAASLHLLSACAVDTTVSPHVPPRRLSSSAPDFGSSDQQRYVILLKEGGDGVVAFADSIAAATGGTRRATFSGAAGGHAGFALANLPPQAVQALQHNPRVYAVVPDVKGYRAQSLSSDSPWWGLDRLDQDGSARDYQFTYYFAGSGVHVYIVDSGIDSGNPEFSGRIGTGHTGAYSPYVDFDGHGTEVASAAAGSTYGTAKSATIHPVQICDYDCTSIWITAMLEGLDWINASGQAPGVVNISYEFYIDGFPTQTLALDYRSRLQTLSSKYVIAKAAGNKNVDACTESGGTTSGMLVVGASTSSDTRWQWSSTVGSNYGNCVSLYAPGEYVYAADRGTGSPILVSGSSIATPYVAGIAAQIYGERPTSTPTEVTQVIMTSASYVPPTGLPTAISKVANSLHHYVWLNGQAVVRTTSLPVSKVYSASVVGGGGPGSWSYAWFANGVPVGTNSSSYTRTFAANSSGTVHLLVQATSLGKTVSQTLDVTVIPDSQCGGGVAC